MAEFDLTSFPSSSFSSLWYYFFGSWCHVSPGLGPAWQCRDGHHYLLFIYLPLFPWGTWAMKGSRTFSSSCLCKTQGEHHGHAEGISPAPGHCSLPCFEGSHWTIEDLKPVRKDNQIFFSLTENAGGLDIWVTANSPSNTFWSIHTKGERSPRHVCPWDGAKCSFQ